MVADGVPLLWLSSLFGKPLKGRVNGVDLVVASCRLAAKSSRGVFLLGGKPGIADKAATNLRSRFSELTICGTLAPVADDIESNLPYIVETINRARPALLFVGLGAPRQDVWIQQNRLSLKVPISMGVGGAFDILSGQKPRAPIWMRQNGLEWCFRLLTDTGYLWKRYLVDDPRALSWLVWHEIKNKFSAKVQTGDEAISARTVGLE